MEELFGLDFKLLPGCSGNNFTNPSGGIESDAADKSTEQLWTIPSKSILEFFGRGAAIMLYIGATSATSPS
jgi:hypothetical protein